MTRARRLPLSAAFAFASLGLVAVLSRPEGPPT